MKHFAIFSFILIIGSIIVSSFFFIGNDAVKDSTKAFIQEVIKNESSSQLTTEENAQIKAFFKSFKDHNLPHPVIDGVEIPYYDVFTEPTKNDDFLQYISVKYDTPDSTRFVTDINFEYILYNEKNGNPKEIYFGKLTVGSFNAELDLISVTPMQKQK